MTFTRYYHEKELFKKERGKAAGAARPSSLLNSSSSDDVDLGIAAAAAAVQLDDFRAL